MKTDGLGKRIGDRCNPMDGRKGRKPRKSWQNELDEVMWKVEVEEGKWENSNRR